MEAINNNYFAAEQYDFKPFSEDDLAMIMGGGGEEQWLDFWPSETAQPGDDADLAS